MPPENRAIHRTAPAVLIAFFVLKPITDTMSMRFLFNIISGISVLAEADNGRLFGEVRTFLMHILTPGMIRCRARLSD